MQSNNSRRNASVSSVAMLIAMCAAIPAVAQQAVPAPTPAAPIPAPPAKIAPANQVAPGALTSPAAIGPTLKDFEKVERERTLRALKKEAAESISMGDAGMPANGQMSGLAAPMSPDGKPMPTPKKKRTPPEDPRVVAQRLSEPYKVVSVVSFRDSVFADILFGGSVTTIRVGDRLGPGTVAAITPDVGVRLAVPVKGIQQSITLGRATEAQISIPSGGAVQNVAARPVQPPNPFPDASSVPVVGAAALPQGSPGMLLNPAAEPPDVSGPFSNLPSPFMGR